MQGLADTFMALRMPFDSQAAKELNIKIFETIYHGALEASNELAARDGAYETWVGSPAQQGQLQYDLWGVTPTSLWDWASLKEKIAKTGLRNSLLVSPMPTASTSQILGNNECFEPYTRYFLSRLLLMGRSSHRLTAIFTLAVFLLGNSKSFARGFFANSLIFDYGTIT